MFEFIFLALGLGIKHSFDADHLIGVSNILAKSKSIMHTIKMALSWAGGHMLTASLITVLLFLFRDSILSIVLEKFELLVGIMLIVLGTFSLYKARIFHKHLHGHEVRQHSHLHLHLKNKDEHVHMHMFGIGIVHGLASNDELLLLLTVSLGLTSLIDMIAGVAIFSFGVVIGMIAFSIFLTYPIIKVESEKLHRLINVAVGSISIIYGFAMLFGL